MILDLIIKSFPNFYIEHHYVNVVLLNVIILSVVAPCRLYSATIAILLLSKLAAAGSRTKKASNTTNIHS